jgi:hypothetical protein
MLPAVPLTTCPRCNPAVAWSLWCVHKPHVRLERQEAETVLRKLPGTRRSREPSAIIFVRIRIDHHCTDDVGPRETHAVTILH